MWSMATASMPAARAMSRPAACGRLEITAAMRALQADSQFGRTVAVMPALEEPARAEIQVTLERPSPQREAYILAELLSAGGADPEQVEAILSALRIPAAVLGVLLLVFLVLLFHRQIQRHRRRRHLKARIRRMKKRME